MFYAKNKDLELSALIVHNAIYMHFQKVGRIIRTFIIKNLELVY